MYYEVLLKFIYAGHLLFDRFTFNPYLLLFVVIKVLVLNLMICHFAADDERISKQR